MTRGGNGRLAMARASLLLCALAFLAAASLPAWAGKPRPVRAAYRDETRQDALSGYLSDRSALRTEELEQLEAVARTADDEIRAMAQRRILDLRRWMEQEATLEAVLAARGYPPALVTVHADSVNILLEGVTIGQAEAAVMLELAERETGVSGGNIKIIPIN